MTTRTGEMGAAAEYRLVNSSVVSGQDNNSTLQRVTGTYHWVDDGNLPPEDLLFSVAVPTEFAAQDPYVSVLGIPLKDGIPIGSSFSIPPINPHNDDNSPSLLVTLTKPASDLPWPYEMLIQFVLDYSDEGRPDAARKPQA